MAIPKKRKAPKSHKADGTPKNRWSPEQRAARGHGPRTRGGRDERPAREDRFGDRAERPRDDRPRRFERDDRPREDRRPFNRDDRPRDDRPRDDRARDERPRRFERDDRRPFSRDDRPRDDRRPFNRDDRPRRFERDERPRDDRRPFNRDDRPRRFERDDRPRDDRRPFNRDDRPRFERDERRPFNRDDRPRDDRPRRFERDDRPRDDRPRFERDDRRRFDRDDRPRRDDRREFRPNRFEDHPRRTDDRRHDDRRHQGRDRFEAEPEADNMSWEAAEAPELDLTGVDSSGGFGALGVRAELAAALTAQGITDPFPIQTATIPDALGGRDVLGRGRTGSGKTLAFGLPLLARIAEAEKTNGAPRALILTPTRELALQIADVMSPLARTLGLNLTLIAGGMAYGPQLRVFQRGVDIVVATPGRLIDLMEQGAVDLSQVLITVLDEADHMADLGFMPAVTTLLDAVPAGGQRMLFSATLDNAVGQLVKRYLHDPVTHEVDSSRASVTTMTHRVLHVLPHDKNAVTAAIANREGRTVVFVRTQMGADRIAGQLRTAGVMAGALHGGLTQGARTRILAAFKDGHVPVLVATDVAARGIHVDDVSLVLQVDPPRDHKDYLHRAGRTARAGESGVVASIVLPHQRKIVSRITGQAGVKSVPMQVDPGSAELYEATGARPASGAPIDEDEYLALIAPKQAVRRPRPEGRGGYGRGRGFGGRREGGRRERW